jgi:hypothetical protein
MLGVMVGRVTVNEARKRLVFVNVCKEEGSLKDSEHSGRRL